MQRLPLPSSTAFNCSNYWSPGHVLSKQRSLAIGNDVAVRHDSPAGVGWLRLPNSDLCHTRPYDAI